MLGLDLGQHSEGGYAFMADGRGRPCALGTGLALRMGDCRLDLPGSTVARGLRSS